MWVDTAASTADLQPYVTSSLQAERPQKQNASPPIKTQIQAGCRGGDKRVGGGVYRGRPARGKWHKGLDLVLWWMNDGYKLSPPVAFALVHTNDKVWVIVRSGRAADSWAGNDAGGPRHAGMSKGRRITNNQETNITIRNPPDIRA